MQLSDKIDQINRSSLYRFMIPSISRNKSCVLLERFGLTTKTVEGTNELFLFLQGVTFLFDYKFNDFNANRMQLCRIEQKVHLLGTLVDDNDCDIKTFSEKLRQHNASFMVNSKRDFFYFNFAVRLEQIRKGNRMQACNAAAIIFVVAFADALGVNKSTLAKTTLYLLNVATHVMFSLFNRGTLGNYTYTYTEFMTIVSSPGSIEIFREFEADPMRPFDFNEPICVKSKILVIDISNDDWRTTPDTMLKRRMVIHWLLQKNSDLARVLEIEDFLLSFATSLVEYIDVEILEKRYNDVKKYF